MPEEGTDEHSSSLSLLSADEPPPFVVRNPRLTQPLLLVCDHASRRIPRRLGDMGLASDHRRSHLAWDIGVSEITQRLADSLQTTAVICQYSRLVIDCNRQLDDPGAYVARGDGVTIPGNSNLSDRDRRLRVDEIYWPYHAAIGSQIERLRDPAFVSIHSFTAQMDGQDRPWDVGVLWDEDAATAEYFMHRFGEAGLSVGNNQPYSGKAAEDFTIDYHAQSAGLRHVGIEIRQDLIGHAHGVDNFSTMMHDIISALPARRTAKDVVSPGAGELV